MGVPRFFRWISERYPKCNSVITDLTLMPVFDNLYLDMNGIIHQCSHPDDNAPSPSERDMLLSIFAYIDRIVKQIVRCGAGLSLSTRCDVSSMVAVRVSH